MLHRLIRGRPLTRRVQPLLHSSHFTRTFRTNVRPLSTSRFPGLLAVSGAALAATLAFAHPQGPLFADSKHLDGSERHDGPGQAPLSALIRSYVVYTACSIPGLVDWSPQILSTFMSVPGLKQVTEAIVRVTFFDQFVGGDTAHATLPVLEQLRSENKGCLFAYSVEVDETEAAGNAKSGEKQPAHKRIVQEMIRSIDVAAEFEDAHLGSVGNQGRRTWVAVKLSALLPNAKSLLALSEYIVNTRSELPAPVAFPGKPRPTDLDVLHSKLSSPNVTLTAQDVHDLQELYDDLVRICTRAQEKKVRMIIDAEHSWYQPAIDAFGLALMRYFNKLPNNMSTPRTSNVRPLVYVTYQAYLRRNVDYLAQSIADAKAGGYALGVKLVRGAYHPYELKAHETRRSTSSPDSHSLSISNDHLPPVWPTKPETDACYNECTKILLDEVAKDAGEDNSSRSWLPFSGILRRRKRESVPKIGVLFGSHNWDSMKLILDTLVDKKLAKVVRLTEDGESVIRVEDNVAERVTMAQLYGMCDSLTNYIVDRTRSSYPMVLKYVPYGALVEVMPYLSRRAIENKSVLGGGGAVAERAAAVAAIRAKLFG